MNTMTWRKDAMTNIRLRTITEQSAETKDGMTQQQRKVYTISDFTPNIPNKRGCSAAPPGCDSTLQWNYKGRRLFHGSFFRTPPHRRCRLIQRLRAQRCARAYAKRLNTSVPRWHIFAYILFRLITPPLFPFLAIVKIVQRRRDAHRE